MESDFNSLAPRGRSRPFAGIKHSSSVYALMQDISFDGKSVFGPCAIHIEQPHLCGQYK